MRLYPTLALVLVTFAAGLWFGREFFPNNGKGSNSPAEEKLAKTEKKRLFADRNGLGGGAGTKASKRNTAAAASASSVAEVLDQVDPNDALATSNRLREALGELGSAELEGLLVGMEGVPATDPRFYTARTAVFNYLAAADPARTVQFCLEHTDKAFRDSFTGMALRALALTDLPAARAALEQIEDKNLRKRAHGSIISAAFKSNPAMVAQLLDENDDMLPAYHSYSPYSYGFDPFGSSYISSYGGYTVLHTNNSQLIGQWADENPAAAEAYARGIEDSAKRSAALGAIAASLARRDPDGALDWARALQKSDGRDNAVLSVVGLLAQKDPQHVAGMLDELATPQQRSSMISTIASQWVQKDQAAALAWLDGLPGNRARAQAYNSVIYQITQSDPQSAATIFDKLPLNNRNHMASNIASTWAQQDLAAARDWVLGLDAGSRNNALNSMFTTWAKEDSAGAIDFLINSAESHVQNRTGLFSTMSAQMALDDRGTAIEWAQGLEEKDTRRSAFGGIYNQWAASNAEEVAAHLESVDDPLERETLLSSLANQWASRDPDAAFAWFEQLPAADLDEAGTTIAQALSYSVPEKAAAWFDQVLASAGGNEEKLSSLNASAASIASQWTAHDPRAAAAWAGELEDESARRDAIGRVASQWMQFDPHGASEWLREMPAGKIRDNAAQQLINQISHRQPAEAFEWAVSISDSKQRFNSVRNVIQSWHHRDKAAAREAFDSLTDITPEQRQKLERHFR